MLEVAGARAGRAEGQTRRAEGRNQSGLCLACVVAERGVALGCLREWGRLVVDGSP